MKTLPSVPNITFSIRSLADAEKAIRLLLNYIAQLKNAIEPTLPAS